MKRQKKAFELGLMDQLTAEENPKNDPVVIVGSKKEIHCYGTTINDLRETGYQGCYLTDVKNPMRNFRYGGYILEKGEVYVLEPRAKFFSILFDWAFLAFVSSLISSSRYQCLLLKFLEINNIRELLSQFKKKGKPRRK